MTPARKGVVPAGDARLIALLDGEQVARVYQERTGRFRLEYDDAWRQRADAYPLSLSLPLAAREHPHAPVAAFLWGLLPDNERTLDGYRRIFGVRSTNPVALLAHIGADCAGAVQLVPPERLGELAGEGTPAEVEWLDESAIATELRTARLQGIPGESRRTAGQFSLAGAQPKIALLREGERWGRPRGRVPTNRILKPPTGGFMGFAENEHFCLELASALGLGAVRSRVARFEEETAIVVERFDRVHVGGRWVRVHQEDCCQALGVMPTRKYESEGGPGAAGIVRLLRAWSRRPQDDVERFVAAMALQWVLGATDGHAKNFALLHGRGGGVRLAPFYDIASVLPYSDRQLHDVRLAMRIGPEYLLRRIGRRQWERFARAVGVRDEAVVMITGRVIDQVAAEAPAVRDRCIGEGLDAGIIGGLADAVVARARECRRAIDQA
ncbi:MAG TPA: type II toxin-antitoxin system HipA family toxin [Gemmatimonadales bacterium]